MVLAITIITGQSGSGKSTVMRAFEDYDYFCVDNLPARLLQPLISLAEQEHSSIKTDGVAHHKLCDSPKGRAQSVQQLAVVMDIRDMCFVENAPMLIESIKKGPHPVCVLYLHAQEDELIRRYSETRRKHPLDQNDGLRAAIERERQQLTNLRELADERLDTSFMSPHELRAHIVQNVLHPEPQTQLRINVLSFGFKFGLPSEANMVLDVRFLPNPYFQENLRKKTGRDEAVKKFVFEDFESQHFLQHTNEFLGFLIPGYQREGRHYFTLGIGCTGGQHRSVAIAEHIAQKLSAKNLLVNLRHRDIQEP